MNPDTQIIRCSTTASLYAQLYYEERPWMRNEAGEVGFIYEGNFYLWSPAISDSEALEIEEEFDSWEYDLNDAYDSFGELIEEELD